MKVFTCPSDQTNTPIGQMTNNNYALNFGNTNYTQQANLNGVVFGGAPFRTNFNGTLQRETLVGITDGTSNTLMIGEVLQGQGSDLRGFIWWGDASGFETYLGPNSPLPDRIYTSFYCNNQPQRNLPCDVSTTTDPTMFASRSRHSGGVQVGLCDGSVRFVRDSININNWRAASTSRGGETLGLDN